MTTDIYAPFRARLEELRMKAQGATFDYETEMGNKAARSYVFSLRKEKGDIESTRKAAKAEVLERGKAIDEGAKAIVGEIDDLIAVHTRHLEAIAARETARVARLTEALERVQAWARECDGSWRTMAQERFDVIAEGIAKARTFDWQEKLPTAQMAIDDATEALAQALTDRAEYDAELAELLRLRQEEAERQDRADREREAAEAKERDERIAKAAAEKAERDAHEAAQAEQRRRDAEAQRQIDEANHRAAEAERAAQAERDRLAREEAARVAEAKRVADAQAARDADAANRLAVKAGAVALLIDYGIDPEAAAHCVEAIAGGVVPSIRITY